MVKSTVEISQNFAAFSEYMNFNKNQPHISLKNIGKIRPILSIGSLNKFDFFKNFIVQPKYLF